MEKRVVLVTGASRGLGRAIAIEFAKLGYYIIINYRKKDDEARKTLDLVREAGGDGVVAKADVSDPNQVESMFKEVEREVDGIDIVVNNAGWGLLSPVESMSNELWNRHIAVNLNGVFYVTKRALPYMLKKKWGRIINITSIAGLRGLKWLSAYSAAKAGIIGFTKALAQELAHSGITVNAVAVGFAKTDMGLSFFKATGISLDVFTTRFTLTGSLVDPSEVGKLVVFLASDSARNITGQVYVIDSGQSLALDFMGLLQE